LAFGLWRLGERIFQSLASSTLSDAWRCRRWIFYDPRPDLHTVKTRAREWELLKSDWRTFHALFFYLGPPSHILWNIKWPFIAINFISYVVQYYGLMSGDQQWRQELSHLRTAFTMSSFCMSLLLSYRVNRAYERWSQARSSISSLGSGATSIFMQCAIWCRHQPEKSDALDDLRRFCIVWPYSILQVLRGSDTLLPAATNHLHKEEQVVYSGSRKGRQVVATAIRCIVNDLDLGGDKLMACESLLQSAMSAGGAALRIRFAALPQALSLVSTGFILLWCALLPFGLLTDQFVGDIDQGALIAVAIISLLLLSVDEVASQLEDPFPFIPLEDICTTYERDIMRIQREMDAIQAATASGHRRGLSNVLPDRPSPPPLLIDLLQPLLETGGSS
jgi:putative membrane protein